MSARTGSATATSHTATRLRLEVDTGQFFDAFIERKTPSRSSYRSIWMAPTLHLTVLADRRPLS